MRSKSMFTWSAVRRSVPLNIMCSRKWLTPTTSIGSSRVPVFTKNPQAAVWAVSFASAMMVSPLSRVVWWN
jgi:hypothetical protein